jgi:hypothetical protein
MQTLCQILELGMMRGTMVQCSKMKIATDARELSKLEQLPNF